MQEFFSWSTLHAGIFFTYGIQQIDSVDEETLLLFTSKTDKAYLRGSVRLFYGES